MKNENKILGLIEITYILYDLFNRLKAYSLKPFRKETIIPSGDNPHASQEND